MNETYMTVVGNVVADPQLRVTKTGHTVANFRVASTPRRYDRESATWVDCPTLFVHVTCWRAMAENVGQSLRKGQPVVVTGRYYARPYEVNETVKIAYELDATAVGHDLSRGTTQYTKAFRPAGVSFVEADADGMPVDDSELWLDRRTGEVLDPDGHAPGATAGSSVDGAGSGDDESVSGLETVELPELVPAS